MDTSPAWVIGSGALIGLALGATGGGGSLLAIPLLVYLLGMKVQPATVLSLMVVAASAWIGVYQLWRSCGQNDSGFTGESCAERFPRSCWVKVSLIGLVVGLLTGFFGVGGGFVIVPALTLVLGFPMRMAVSTSLLIIALVAVGGLVGHLQTGQMDWPLSGLLLLGSAIGMTGGSWVAQQVPQATLAKSFAAIAILVAIVMVIHNGMKLFGVSV